MDARAPGRPPLRTLGIVGGIAPASTIDYYRLIIDRWRELRNDASYPSIVINSIDMTRLLMLAGERRLDELADWLLIELGRLERAGADVALLASNTPHLVFDALSERSPIPLLSIVEAAAEDARARGVRQAGLLGTRFTMEGGFYAAAFARRGMAVRSPDRDDIAWVHQRYVGELIEGEFRPETRSGIVRVIGRMQRDGAEAIVLAGTELPLLLRDAEGVEIPLLDTTRIHVERAVRALLE